MNVSHMVLVSVLFALLSACSQSVPAPAEVVSEIPSPVPTTAGFAKLGSNAIFVSEQQPGNEVVVHIVNHDKGGFVAIHDSRESASGPVLGVSELLEAGTQSKFEIALSRDTQDGDALTAAVYADNGDGVFDLETDIPMTEFTNSPLMMYFTVSAEATDPRDTQIAF